MAKLIFTCCIDCGFKTFETIDKKELSEKGCQVK